MITRALALLNDEPEERAEPDQKEGPARPDRKEGPVERTGPGRAVPPQEGPATRPAAAVEGRANRGRGGALAGASRVNALLVEVAAALNPKP